MKNTGMSKLALCSLGLLLSIPFIAAAGKGKHLAGTPVTSFNAGGPKPGLSVRSLSQFLDLAEGIGIQKFGCDYKIVVNGDSVNKPNFSGQSAFCLPAEGTTCYLTPPPSCASSNCCTTVDGWFDERCWSLLRFNSNGSPDATFGPANNGTVIFNGQDPYAGFQPIGNYSSTTPTPGLLIVPSSQEIIYVGNNQLAQTSDICGNTLVSIPLLVPPLHRQHMYPGVASTFVSTFQCTPGCTTCVLPATTTAFCLTPPTNGCGACNDHRLH